MDLLSEINEAREILTTKIIIIWMVDDNGIDTILKILIVLKNFVDSIWKKSLKFYPSCISGEVF